MTSSSESLFSFLIYMILVLRYGGATCAHGDDQNNATMA